MKTIFLFLIRKLSMRLKYRAIVFLNAGEAHNKIKKSKHMQDLMKVISINLDLFFFQIRLFCINCPNL